MAPTAKPPQNILGVVSTFGNSLSALKDDLKVAFGDYPEAAQDEKEDWYDEIAKIKDFEYEMDMQAF